VVKNALQSIIDNSNSFNEYKPLLKSLSIPVEELNELARYIIIILEVSKFYTSEFSIRYIMKNDTTQSKVFIQLIYGTFLDFVKLLHKRVGKEFDYRGTCRKLYNLYIEESCPDPSRSIRKLTLAKLKFYFNELN
jgi:hypothetical protein